MASFLDILPTFKPYVQQLPVEAMVQVGMQKQTQYNQGVEKIQGEIDKIAGLDIARDVDKNYLQKKLNSLGDKLTFYAAGDFSDFQLTNSVAGMTKDVVKDSVVQNAVSSTAWSRKQREKIEKGKSDGTWSVENEDLYNTQYAKWYNSLTPGESFSSEYIPYKDVYKKLREIAKDVGVDEKLVQNLFNPDGSVNKVMVETYSKGKDPNKIYEAFVTGLDETDYRQLAITGRYKYKGYDNQQLIQTLQSSNDEYVATVNARKLDFQQEIKRIDNAMLTVKKPEEKQQLEDQKNKLIEAIGKIDEQVGESISAFNLSKQKLASGDQDYADGIRARLHTNKFLTTLSRDFADSNSYVKFSENPLWKAIMEEDKFAFDKWYKNENLKIEKRKAAAAEKANKLKEDEIKMITTPGPIDGGTPPTQANVQEAFAGLLEDRKSAYLLLAQSAFSGDAKAMEEYVNSAIKVLVKDAVTGETRNKTKDEVIQELATQEYTRVASIINDKTGKFGSASMLNPRLIEAATKIASLNPMISSMKSTMEQIEKDAYLATGLTPKDISISKSSIARPMQIAVRNPDGTRSVTTINVSGEDMFNISAANEVEGYIGIAGWFASKKEKLNAKKARTILENKYGKVIADGLIEQGGDLIKVGVPVSEVKNDINYVNFEKELDKRYNDVFSGFFPRNKGFIMTDKNRDPIVSKLNTVLLDNPLYTEDARKSLFENGSQIVFKATPEKTGFGPAQYGVVITGKDGKIYDSIPISPEQYKILAEEDPPGVDMFANLTRAKINSSPDKSTNQYGVGSWTTAHFPGSQFTGVRGYNIGGMDLVESFNNPNVFFPMIYLAPPGSTDYKKVPIMSPMSLSEGLYFPSTLTDAKLKAKGIK